MHTLLARNRKRVRHVRRFHVAELQRHVRESRRDRSDNDGLFIIHARPICSNNRENDVLFVQDVVVLEIVKERGWSQVRGAGQERRRARDDRRVMRRFEGRTARDAEPADAAIRTIHMCHCIVEMRAFDRT